MNSGYGEYLQHISWVQVAIMAYIQPKYYEKNY
jgi:hypothetical protein